MDEIFAVCQNITHTNNLLGCFEHLWRATSTSKCAIRRQERLIHSVQFQQRIKTQMHLIRPVHQHFIHETVGSHRWTDKPTNETSLDMQYHSLTNACIICLKKKKENTKFSSLPLHIYMLLHTNTQGAMGNGQRGIKPKIEGGGEIFLSIFLSNLNILLKEYINFLKIQLYSIIKIYCIATNKNILFTIYSL